jgi:hypothetical protein
MAKIWSEPFDHLRHHDPMGWVDDEPQARARHWRAPTLEPHRVTFVRVAGFTFEFHSLEQIRLCLAFYRQRLQQTSRLPIETGEYGGDHTETQRWFERLPLYLREEPKRQKVVKALELALTQASTGQV